MSDNHASSTSSSLTSLVTPKRVLALVIAIVALIFVFSNTDPVSLQWLWFTVEAPAWILLLLVLLAGAIAGFAMGRRHYKDK